MQQSSAKLQSQNVSKLYVVETKGELYVSDRKLDAVYKHCEFRYGQARYREVDSDKLQTTKKVIRL